jgi:hypothetical protein
MPPLSDRQDFENSQTPNPSASADDDVKMNPMSAGKKTR